MREMNGHARGEDDAPEEREVEAVVIVDTRDAERRLGFRGLLGSERRVLYRGPSCFLEIRVPTKLENLDEDEKWLYGQWVVPEDQEWRYEGPIHLRLSHDGGRTEGGRATDEGDFALPLAGNGKYCLSIEPRAGPRILARFEI